MNAKQRCNHCMSVFDDELTECPKCGKDDALMSPYIPEKKTTKHTPGPWKAQRDIRHFTNTGCLTKESAKGWAVYGPSQRIACVSNSVGVQWDQDKLAEADAMLIAMAPDLLAISQRIHDEINGLNATLRACDARYEKSVLCQRLNDLIRDNAAVLQKATGEQ